MKIKEFLKPTLVKIIIFLIISQIFIPFIFYYSDNPKSLGLTFRPSSEGGRGISIPSMPPREVTIGSVLTYVLDSSSGVRMDYISYPILIVGLIISYLISCLIVFSINKLKKKKK